MFLVVSLPSYNHTLLEMNNCHDVSHYILLLSHHFQYHAQQAVSFVLHTYTPAVADATEREPAAATIPDLTVC
jgi:hypothetical protein